VKNQVLTSVRWALDFSNRLPVSGIWKIQNHQTARFHERTDKDPTVIGGYLVFFRERPSSFRRILGVFSKKLRILVIYNNQVFDSLIILIINFQLWYPEWYPSGVSCNFYTHPSLVLPDQCWAVFTFFENHQFWFFMLLCENWVGSWLFFKLVWERINPVLNTFYCIL
jgi:hypothetical protein